MSYESDESEIEASRAPLLDHLIELRKRLIVCLAALAVAFFLCFAFATQIFNLLLHPFSIAAQLLAIRAAEPAHAGGFDLLGVFSGARNMRLASVTAPIRSKPPCCAGASARIARSWAAIEKGCSSRLKIWVAKAKQTPNATASATTQ